MIDLHKIIGADEITDISDYIKKAMEKDKHHLFELAARAVSLSKQYPTEPQSAVFDFRDPDYFYLWFIENGNERIALSNETYRSKPASICVGGFFQAAQYDWFGKSVDRDVFKEEVSELFPNLYAGFITHFLKTSRGVKIFGYSNDEEKVNIEHIPKGIVL